MQVRCPSCGASNSLDTLVEHEAASRVLARTLETNPVGAHLVRYLALHRPGKSSLRFGRVESLLCELLPDIERGAVNRKGRDWPAPPELWRSAIEVLLAKRDARTLTLPLSGHGLLYEVLAGLSDKLEGIQERATEADRRQRGAVASATVSANTPPLYRPEPSTPAKPTREQLEKLRAVALPLTRGSTGAAGEGVSAPTTPALRATPPVSGGEPAAASCNPVSTTKE